MGNNGQGIERKPMKYIKKDIDGASYWSADYSKAKWISPWWLVVVLVLIIITTLYGN